MGLIRRVLFTFLAVAIAAMAQSNTATLDGLVKDAQGALVPNAVVTVANTLTQQTFRTVTDEKGHWAVPALPTATYSVAVEANGFKKVTAPDVHMDAGIPATVNVTLEVGTISETVEVQGGAEVLQTTSATVTTDLTGRQVSDLPIPSRNATDLLVTMPGTQTPAGPRNTTFFGLPQATMNMTLDGVNIQDNLLKNSSGGAFYPVVYPRTDAIEEVSVTSAASGAENLGEGAVQIKFVTKSGTNEWHGGAFVQERNTALNANTYFNNIDGLRRDRIILHQVGAHVGGPIVKNRAFIFFNYEVFRFPQSWNAGQFQSGGFLTVLTDPARNGIFTYQDTTRQLRTVDLYALAQQGGFPSTPDPILGNTLSQIAKATGGGSLFSRVASNNDYNRSNFNFLTPGEHKIDFPQGKLDVQLTQKHHWEATGGVNPYRLFPDGINGVIPIFPGSGTVLGSPANAGQREAFWTGSTALRSAWSAHWTSEIRLGLSAGNVLFFNDVTPNLFAPWRGFAPVFGATATNVQSYVTNPYTRSNFSRRNDPVGQLQGNVSWIRSGHLFNFGGSYTQINEWVQGGSTQFIPQVAFGVQSTDPVLSLFNGTNFPNSSAADLANAENLYALLTGRVSQINRSVVLDEKTHTYGANGAVDRVRQREFGVYAQDTWKLRPGLTLSYGARVENQYPFRSLSGTYTRPGYAGLYGVSGVGNLFKPGTLTGSVPQLTVVTPDDSGYPPTHFLSPTAGVAWVLPTHGGLLAKIFGQEGQSVFRAGFAATSTRDQLTITGVWGNNQGRTISTALDPISNAPDIFGPAGSVLFRNDLPVRTVASAPTYPIAVASGTTVNDYDPNLKSRYVESWNVSLQRSLSRNTALDIRYVGNRSERALAGINLNEINIVESGFLDQFKLAQSNLAIARATTPTTTNFFNQGLPGQQPIPIISTALANSANSTLANYVLQGQAAAFANSIAGTSAQMARLVAAGYAPNLFLVNPSTGGSGANLTTNQGGSTYNALQVELSRRMSAGLLAGVSYTWSHSLATGNLLSLRNRDGATFPSAFDQRHSFKFNWVYELPIGPNHRFLSAHNPVLRKAAEGWQVSGISRIVSGVPSRLLSGRATFNGTDGGVVLYNMTNSQLQDMTHIRKLGNGLVEWLPQNVIDNTLAAFQLNTKTLDPTQPYIGPASTPGQLGNQVFVYGPWFQKWDISLMKKTMVGEKKSIEFRANALNVFNLTNFFLVGANAGNIGVNSAFGQTRNAFNDINSTNDPGSRVVEFALRFSF